MNQPVREPLAIDMALEVGRGALGKLRRLRSEIADAQGAEDSGRRFWPIAVFSLFRRGGQRRRIAGMTADVQQDLAALDAAVETLREAGAALPDREGFRAAKGTRPVAPPSWFGRRDPWQGPLHVVDTTLARVERILDVLRTLRPGSAMSGGA